MAEAMRCSAVMDVRAASSAEEGVSWKAGGRSASPNTNTEKTQGSNEREPSADLMAIQLNSIQMIKNSRPRHPFHEGSKVLSKRRQMLVAAYSVVIAGLKIRFHWVSRAGEDEMEEKQITAIGKCGTMTTFLTKHCDAVYLHQLKHWSSRLLTP